MDEPWAFAVMQRLSLEVDSVPKSLTVVMMSELQLDYLEARHNTGLCLSVYGGLGPCVDFNSIGGTRDPVVYYLCRLRHVQSNSTCDTHHPSMGLHDFDGCVLVLTKTHVGKPLGCNDKARCLFLRILVMWPHM
jgi:hypothetical protein